MNYNLLNYLYNEKGHTKKPDVDETPTADPNIKKKRFVKKQDYQKVRFQTIY